MANMKNKIALSFDDVLIEPGFSSVKRGECDVTPKPFKNIAPKIPIISSPMDSVTGPLMIEEFQKINALAIHHRYCDKNILKEISLKYGNNIPIAVGSIYGHEDIINSLILLGHKFFVIDIALGDSEKGIKTYEYIRKLVPDADIMSGNIATPRAAKNVINAGCNILRVSIGSGSACTTRIVTGVGVPAATTIKEISDFINSEYTNIIIVADGGIRSSGDLTKALALGADYVICGGIFAGSFESNSKMLIVDENKKQYEIGNVLPSNIDNCDELDIIIFDKFLEEKIKSMKWSKSTLGYATLSNRSQECENLLHRFIFKNILNANLNNKLIDHINGNKLDNRLMNLRICTKQQNNCNKNIQSNNKYNYKGIYFDKNKCSWSSEIHINSEKIFLGYCNTMQEAIDLYDKNAKELFGEFSSPNIRNSPGIKLYKTYRGMASKSALIEGNNKNPNHLHIEGEEFLTIYTGPVKNIVNKLIRGLQQGMFYTGSKTLEELKESTVIQITNAGNIEGTAHGSKL